MSAYCDGLAEAVVESRYTQARFDVTHRRHMGRPSSHFIRRALFSQSLYKPEQLHDEALIGNTHLQVLQPVLFFRWHARCRNLSGIMKNLAC
jgi:hypothetical protein